MKPKEIREAGRALGREGLALRALEIAKEMVEDGGYKRAIKGAGQLKVIAQACGYDDYWEEKALRGEYSENKALGRLARLKNETPVFCGECLNLSMTEDEQDEAKRYFESHKCNKFGFTLLHGKEHPHLRRPAQCVGENGYEKREK